MPGGKLSESSIGDKDLAADLDARLNEAQAQGYDGGNQAAVEAIARIATDFGDALKRHRAVAKRVPAVQRELKTLRAARQRLSGRMVMERAWASDLRGAVEAVIAAGPAKTSQDRLTLRAGRAMLSALDAHKEAGEERQAARRASEEAGALRRTLPGRQAHAEEQRRLLVAAQRRVAEEEERLQSRADEVNQCLADTEAITDDYYWRGLLPVLKDWRVRRGDDAARDVLDEVLTAGAPAWLASEVYPRPETWEGGGQPC